MIALLLALAAAATGPGDPLEEACYAADHSQQGMNRCAGDAFQRADEALNLQWAKVTAVFADDAEGKTLLVDTQRAWLKYRDGQCKLAALDSVGGSIWLLINSSCLAELTRQRTKQLIDLLGEGD